MSVEKKPTKQDFLKAISIGAECSLTEGKMTNLTTKGVVWAIDSFGNEYFPKIGEGGKPFFEKTYDKFQGNHNEVVL